MPLQISPLVALMEDQVAGMLSRGIPAACVHSGRAESLGTMEEALDGAFAVVLMSPEWALSHERWFRMLSAKHMVALLAVDECHCKPASTRSVARVRCHRIASHRNGCCR